MQHSTLQETIQYVQKISYKVRAEKKNKARTIIYPIIEVQNFTLY